jgi:ArsR family transcriptional regulator
MRGAQPLLKTRAIRQSPSRSGRSILYYSLRLIIRNAAKLVDNNIGISLIDKEEHIETAARALKAIAHPLRLKILCVLGEGEICVQDIVDAVGTSQSNISQHLAILRDKGVLQTRKDANRVFYRVGDQRTLQLIVLMREVFCGVKGDTGRQE